MIHTDSREHFRLRSSFNPVERLQYWEKQELQEQGEGPTTRVEVDEASYLEGWRDSVKEIWQAISPAP